MSKDDVSRKGIVDLPLTVSDLVSFQPAYEALRGMTLKGGKGARRIGKVLSIIRVEMEEYINLRKELIKEHGEENEDGGGHWINPKEKRQTRGFWKAHDELMGEPVDFRFRPICILDFGKSDIPLLVISDLHQFFNFKEDTVEPKPKPTKVSAHEDDEEFGPDGETLGGDSDFNDIDNQAAEETDDADDAA